MTLESRKTQHRQAGRDGGPEPGRDVEPVDYAEINAVYALLAAAVIATTRGRMREDPIRAGELPQLAAASFALSKVVAREKIGVWVRDPFVEEQDGDRQPRGRRLRRAMGELVTCTRCVGAWSALGLVGLRLYSPDAGRIATAVLATSAGNDWMQAAFAWLTGKANETKSSR
jgi:Protein of unknown function (DUF1360)